jgi:hypothetical protein
MKTGRDYSCEIMAVIVLTVLSALSHFWYILIALSILAGLAVLGSGDSRYLDSRWQAIAGTRPESGPSTKFTFGNGSGG